MCGWGAKIDLCVSHNIYTHTQQHTHQTTVYICVCKCSVGRSKDLSIYLFIYLSIYNIYTSIHTSIPTPQTNIKIGHPTAQGRRGRQLLPVPHLRPPHAVRTQNIWIYYVYVYIIYNKYIYYTCMSMYVRILLCVCWPHLFFFSKIESDLGDLTICLCATFPPLSLLPSLMNDTMHTQWPWHHDNIPIHPFPFLSMTLQ